MGDQVECILWGLSKGTAVIEGRALILALMVAVHR